jgi:hypothetical protein
MGRKEEGEITWGIEILKGLSQGVETYRILNFFFLVLRFFF